MVYKLIYVLRQHPRLALSDLFIFEKGMLREIQKKSLQMVIFSYDSCDSE